MNRQDVWRDCLQACHRSFGGSSRNANCIHQLLKMNRGTVQLTNPQANRTQGESTQITSEARNVPRCYIYCAILWNLPIMHWSSFPEMQDAWKQRLILDFTLTDLISFFFIEHSAFCICSVFPLMSLSKHIHDHINSSFSLWSYIMKFILKFTPHFLHGFCMWMLISVCNRYMMQ
jgi:hypothetical protein